MRAHWKQLVAALLALGVVITALPWLLVSIGNAFYDSSPGQARLMWTAAKFTALYDRDVVLFDIGNSWLKENSYDNAAAAYEAADRIASDKNRCMIRYNWGLSLSRQGDGLAGSDRAAARAKYSEALGIIALNQCQEDPDYRDNFEQLYKELLEKLAKLDDQAPGQPSPNQPRPGDDQDAEEILQDSSAEADQAQNYQTNRRYDDSRSDNGSSSPSFEFVW